MARALKCDRCGAFYDYIKGLRNYQIRDMNEKNFDKTVDLCPECYEKLCDFLDGAWKSIGMKPKEIVGTGEFEEEKYSDWKDAPWLNQKILEESKRIKGEESDGNSSS